MPSNAMSFASDSQNPSAPQDTPLYAIFQDGEWFFVDEEIWNDLIFRNDQDDQDAQQTYIDINEPL